MRISANPERAERWRLVEPMNKTWELSLDLSYPGASHLKIPGAAPWKDWGHSIRDSKTKQFDQMNLRYSHLKSCEEWL
jgi:hypothetical protein